MKLYEWKQPYCRALWYHGHVYDSIERRRSLTCITPFNFLVRLVLWVLHMWQRSNCGLSWIDEEIKAGVERGRRNDWR